MDPDDDFIPPRYANGATQPDADSATLDDGSMPEPAAPYHPEWYKLHPGWAESLFPVWGPARAAMVDSANGDGWGWAGNSGLALLDLTGAGELIRYPPKLIGSHSWRATRQWLTKTGFAEKGEVVHHGMFERNQGIGKYLPDWLKNQPWNLKPMPSAQIHDRMAHDAWKMPQLNLFQQLHYGTPDWAKWAAPAAVGHVGEAFSGLLGDWRAHQAPSTPNNQHAKK
jgi:hypothetical protein